MKISVIYNYEDIQKSEYIDCIKEFKNDIKKCINECLKEEEIDTENIEVYLKYTTNEEIRKINKEFRDVDSKTDVLSFPMYERQDLEKEIHNNIIDMAIVLGDIVISVEKVKEQSKEYGHSFKRELIYLVTHSMFHLLGYDHIQEEDKKIMREKEDIVMNILNITR